MAKNIEILAKKLGATLVGTVPDYSAGAFGMAALAETLLTVTNAYDRHFGFSTPYVMALARTVRRARS